MEEILKEKRARLESEISVAQELLSKNMQDMDVNDYFSLSSSLIPGILHGVLDKPGKAITNGDMIARTVLPSTNIIRRFFKIISLFTRGFKLITDKS